MLRRGKIREDQRDPGDVRSGGGEANAPGGKFDGYRVQVHLGNEAVKTLHLSRQRLDWTKRFNVAHYAWRIKIASAVIDGEIGVPAANGTTDFSVLPNELKAGRRRPHHRLSPVVPRPVAQPAAAEAPPSQDRAGRTAGDREPRRH